MIWKKNLRASKPNLLPDKESKKVAKYNLEALIHITLFLYHTPGSLSINGCIKLIIVARGIEWYTLPVYNAAPVDGGEAAARGDRGERWSWKIYQSSRFFSR